LHFLATTATIEAMARSGLSGLPPKRPVETALTYLPGVSRARAKAILDQARIDPETRTDDLSELQVDLLRRLLRGAEDDPPSPEDEAFKPWLSGAGVDFALYLDRVRAMLQRYLVVLRPWDRSTDDPTQNPLPAGTVQTLDSTCLRCLRGEALEPERMSYVSRLEKRLQPHYDELKATTKGAQRFEELRAIFALSDLESDLLWLLLAAELVPEFLWLYRAFWRDTTRCQWTEDFLAHGVDPFGVRGAGVLAALGEHSPLLRYGLINAGPDDTTQQRRFRVASFVSGYLLGLEVSLSDLPGVLWHEVPVDAEGQEIVQLPLSDVVRQGLRRGFRGRRRFLVLGTARAGALRIARESLHMFGESLLRVRLKELMEHGVERIGHVLGRARLARAGIFYTQCESIDEGENGQEKLAALVRLLKTETTTMFFYARDDDNSDGRSLSPRAHLKLLRELGCLELATTVPEMEDRKALWQERLGELMSEEVLATVVPAASVYKFGVDEIDLAVNLAAARARQRDPKSADVHISDIESSCRQVASSRLAGLANRVNVRGTWETTVLTEETDEVLKEIISYGKYAGVVLDDQGYGRTMGYGRALTALFSGPSGTGKTLCAGLIARDLGLELFRVDLASVVSKYIGETEERLATLFNASRDAGIALLFDEADSLFSKRTDVSSAVDRYANLEVNYLLQRLEEHDGLVILTTNYPDSIDTAFMRRIRFKPYFPPPEADEREKLWDVMIPSTAPREKDLKLRYLSEDYELTGGQIQNAVIRAAVWAVEAGNLLNHELLDRAAEREYKDMGRIVRVYEDDEEEDPDNEEIKLP
jgi:SpoVK/Ycf46/Vps4 family AAA+-type ATPase